MRSFAIAGALIFLSACAQADAKAITILDGDEVRVVDTDERVPLLILTEAEIGISPNDRLLLNGVPILLDQRLEGDGPMTLQLRRAVGISVVTPDGEQNLETAAMTVGEALSEAGVEIQAGDLVIPPEDSYIDGPMSVRYEPGREYSVSVGGKVLVVLSSADTVGAVLASSGLAPVGLDFTVPGEDEAPPVDGQIRLVRVREETVWSIEPIPFTSEYRDSAELEIGEELIVQAGQPGLAQTRTRIHYEDGKEISRADEARSVIRQPQTRIAERGTKIVLKSAVVDGVPIQYWRVVEMYATSYSPCRSGVPDQCFSGTSLGLPVKKGVVAVDITFYNEMAGQQIFVAGYGQAVIADVGAGRIVEANLGIPRTRWIDLGYSDSDWEQWGRYVTVYFLAPAPAAIPYVLQ